MLWNILGELTGACDFTNTERIQQLFMEFKAGRESAIVGNGHQLAISRAASAFSLASALGKCGMGSAKSEN